jgi:hypothetical protein
MIAILLLVSAAAVALLNSSNPPMPPGVNACFIVDAQHEVNIGPPPVKTENINFWLLLAYALEGVLIVALASFLRIRLTRRNRGSNNGDSPPIPMIHLLQRNP